MEQPDGVVRLITPFYIIDLPDGDWSWSYNGEAHPWMDDDAGWKGHQLTLSLDGSTGTWAAVYATSDDWVGVQGSLVAEVVAPLPGWDGFQVVAVVPGDPGDADYAERLDRLSQVVGAVTVR